jgi:hypothetical protein
VASCEFAGDDVRVARFRTMSPKSETFIPHSSPAAGCASATH